MSTQSSAQRENARESLCGTVQKHRYYYEVLFEQLFGSGSPVLWGYLLLVIVRGLTTLITDRVWGATSLFSDWWWFYPVYCVNVGGGFWFLHLAKHRLRQAIPSALDLMPGPKDCVELRNRLELMGDTRKQALYCSGFGLIGFAIVILPGFIEASFPIRLYSALGAFVALSVSGCGLWTAVTSTLVVRWISSLDSLRLGFVDPAKTRGVSKLSGLMAFFATLFLVQVLLWEIPFVLLILVAPERMPLLNLDCFPFTIARGIFLLFAFVVLLYFLYPQIVIDSLVRDHRERILSDIQERIRAVYRDYSAESVDQGMLLDQYLSLYREVKGSRGSLPLKDLVGFAASFAATLVVSVVGELDVLIQLLTP